MKLPLGGGGGKILPTLLVLGILFYVISKPVKAADTFTKVANGIGTVAESLSTFFSNIT